MLADSAGDVPQVNQLAAELASIADHGRGLAHNRFFSTKGNQGRGLGMSIVNQIITMAGGFIQVDSYPGQGTRIRLYLPLIAGID